MAQPELNDRAQGWLRHLWRKATTADDWSPDGKPREWWDQYSTPPMLSFPRFDLSESGYGLALMADVTPAWREVYTEILDELVSRHRTYWAAVDWLTQIGPDPKREQYPDAYRGLIPAHMWGEYDVPGWTANGVEPWGLQPDPIGSDGNLFFRGFFNLLLSTYAYVSGDEKWQEPFQVAGVERSSHEWTHACIADFISQQWSERPEGPNCENTKIWPYCLTAAGLGLHLFDGVYGTAHHQVFDEWTEYAKKNYMTFTADGRLETIGLYYDPIIDHLHGRSRGGGLGVAFYMLPQNRQLAEVLYEAGIESGGWRNPDVAIPAGDPRGPALVHTLAREFGDSVVEKKLRDHAEVAFEPRAFGDEDREFGYWFNLDEDHPRGQLSALAMCADIGEPGAWWRVFNEPNLTKFDEPTVVGVDYPSVGLSKAWNDPERGVLLVDCHAGSSSSRGSTTRFRVENLQAASVQIRCDDETFEHWRPIDERTIEIEIDIDDHSFEITTSPRSARQALREEPKSTGVGTSQRLVSSSAALAGSRQAIQAAQRNAPSSVGTCPCCVGL
jgi:hypothetical protein